MLWPNSDKSRNGYLARKGPNLTKNTKTNVKEFKATRGLSALVKILELRVQIVIDCSIIMCDDSQ